ncbi:hypothetical protein SAMN05444362_10326 [Dysgonomonas macrotermitis]|uniref:Uncharacterized protein n=1 Tax=Dysgonomonas macrotermitis TaxID=1346286 RepID=A0A1M4XZ16_9BACT|nr:hypothetical protein SAMN05444362_10326 [Dysgonomonas macrotermitis]
MVDYMLSIILVTNIHISKITSVAINTTNVLMRMKKYIVATYLLFFEEIEVFVFSIIRILLKNQTW